MTINKEQPVSDAKEALTCPKCGKHWRDVTLPENASEVLDAFYAAIPEKFGTCMPDDRHATWAASIPLADNDRMWLRGIAAAIETHKAWEHPLAKMVRDDEAMGLYDDESVAPASHPLEQQQDASDALPGPLRRVIHELRLSERAFHDYGVQHQEKAESCEPGFEREARWAKAKRNYGRAAACKAALDGLASLEQQQAVSGDSVERIGRLLARDPICGGRVSSDTVEAIASLTASGMGRMMRALAPFAHAATAAGDEWVNEIPLALDHKGLPSINLTLGDLRFARTALQAQGVERDA